MAISMDAHAAPGPTSAFGVPPGKLGIWWFLASEIMLFGGLIASFVVFRVGGGGWAAESAHLSVPIAALNTLVLLTSSLTMVQAFAAAERGDARGFRTALTVTIALGLVFLCFKGLEYAGKLHAGYTPGSGVFWSFYYTMTGLHALHVLAGIVVNILMFKVGGLRHPHRVELAGLYWHFVDIVWIFLFPLVYLS